MESEAFGIICTKSLEIAGKDALSINCVKPNDRGEEFLILWCIRFKSVT